MVRSLFIVRYNTCSQTRINIFIDTLVFVYNSYNNKNNCMTNYTMPLIFTVLTIYQAVVEAVSELFICASCSLFPDSIADGCTIELQSNQYKFVFNMSRQTSHESSLLECFSVPQPGVYSVSVCEIWFGQVQTHKSRYLILPNVTIEGMVSCLL